MKKLIQFALAGSMLAMTACNDNNSKGENKAEDTKEQAKEANKTDAATDQATADFLVNAANGGMMEVELGKMAQQNARSQQVKDFGNMMVTDHSKANEELKAIAQARNVKLPTLVEGKHRDHMNDLGKKSGAEFDKAYMDMMVDDHQDDIDEFEKAANNLSDEGVKAFAAKTLPVLRTHLQAAKNTQQQLQQLKK